MRKSILALVAGAAVVLGSSAASAATLIGSYWVGGGVYWGTGYPQTAYSPQDAAALLFGGVASDYWISTTSASVTHTAWTDGFGTGDHLKKNWDTGLAGTAVAEDFLPRPTYDTLGAYSAYVCDRECLIGGSSTGPDASINYVFLAVGVPEPTTWALMIGGFGLAGVSLRRRRSAVAAA
jgi:hypothetical protein